MMGGALGLAGTRNVSPACAQRDNAGFRKRHIAALNSGYHVAFLFGCDLSRRRRGVLGRFVVALLGSQVVLAPYRLADSHGA